MGNAVVLQHDALLHLLEEPGDGAADAKAAALVHPGIEPLDHLAGGGHLLGFAGALGVGPVAGHEQARGSHGAYGVDHLAQGVGWRQAIRRRGVLAGFNAVRWWWA